MYIISILLYAGAVYRVYMCPAVDAVVDNVETVVHYVFLYSLSK